MKWFPNALLRVFAPLSSHRIFIYVQMPIVGIMAIVETIQSLS